MKCWHHLLSCFQVCLPFRPTKHCPPGVFGNIVTGYFGVCFWVYSCVLRHILSYKALAIILTTLCPSTHRHPVSLPLDITMKYCSWVMKWRKPCKKCRTFIGDTQMCDSSLSCTCSNMCFRMFPISSQIRAWECLYLLKSFLLLKCSIHIFI